MLFRFKITLLAVSALVVAGLSGCTPSGQTSKSDAPVTPAKGAAANKPDFSKDGPQRPQALEELVPPGPLDHTATRCYALLADMRNEAETISQDLDAGGREVTRLLRTSDELAKKITDLAALWPDDALLRDRCSTAKRAALVLNEELGNVPRKWTHVRWSFDNVIAEVGKLRQYARGLADAEPAVPVLDKHGKPVLDKNGKPTYAEPQPKPADAATVKREEAQREVDEAREKLRKTEDDKKEKKIPTDLDSN